MPSYFQQFPTTPYTDFSTTENTRVLLTNIMTRSSFLKEIMDNTAVFYEYQLKDDETPEIIADKLYGDPNRHWIVLLFNQIINPYYEFPLSVERLENLITTKYNQTIEAAQTTVHHYERRISKTTYLNGTPQATSEERFEISDREGSFSTGVLSATPFLPGTPDTSIEVATVTESFGSGISTTSVYSHWSISNYAYEVEENEKRRTIKLLDKSYVSAVEIEFKRLMSE